MNDEPLHQHRSIEPHHSPEPAPRRRWLSTMPLSAVTTLAAVLVATGSATAWWTWQTLSVRKSIVTPPDTEAVMPSTGGMDSSETGQVPTTTQAPDQTQNPETAPPLSQELRSISVYWVKDTGTHLEVVPTSIFLAEDQPPEDLLKSSLERVIQGPEEDINDAQVASTVPQETQINFLEIRADGIHVDLNQAFTSGGGSASMIGRLGQVVYTATTLDPDANVWISVNGEPLEVLGGEGLLVAQPMTREIFDRDFAM